MGIATGIDNVVKEVQDTLDNHFHGVVNSVDEFIGFCYQLGWWIGEYDGTGVVWIKPNIFVGLFFCIEETENGCIYRLNNMPNNTMEYYINGKDDDEHTLELDYLTVRDIATLERGEQ
jgi:hypothetical protein